MAGCTWRRSEFFEWVLNLYRRSLRWVLDNPALVLTVLLLTIALNVVMVIKIPKGFFPQQDTGALGGAMRGPEDCFVSGDERTLLQVQHIDQGGSGGAERDRLYRRRRSDQYRQYVCDSEAAERAEDQRCGRDQPAAAKPLSRITGASTFLQASQDLRIGGRGSNALYQYTIQADNVNDLQTWGPKLLAAMKKLPGFQDVSSDQQNGGLDQMVTFDRVTAARLGQTASSLDSALYADFGQSEVSLIYTQLNQYYVVLEVAPQYWATPEGLKDVYLHPSHDQSDGDGEYAAADALRRCTTNTTPLALNHTGLFPSVTVSFNLANGYALSDATLAIDADAAAAGHAFHGARSLCGHAAGVPGSR